MGFRRKVQESPKVDLTPMIDVVFLLLIFFMISTTFIEQPGLSIDLPESGSDQIKQTEKDLHIYLTASGDIYLERTKVTKAALEAHLATYKPAVAGTMTFLLMADKEARHGQVVELMGMARAAGFSQLAIATEAEEKTSSGDDAKKPEK